ncbi:hypothetical protein TKK_0012438 [Trichogramma kaykai]
MAPLTFKIIFSNAHSVACKFFELQNAAAVFDVIACVNWENIIQCVDVSRAALFMGDFNAHNKSWNCALCDNNGLNFEQAYAARGLSL